MTQKFYAASEFGIYFVPKSTVTTSLVLMSRTDFDNFLAKVVDTVHELFVSFTDDPSYTLTLFDMGFFELSVIGVKAIITLLLLH